MRRKLCVLLLACGVCHAAPERTVVTGNTQDCLAGKVYRTAGVEVSVLPKSAQLVALIEAVQKANDNNVFDRFDKLIQFVHGAKTLGRTKSGRDGSFRVEIPAVEEVIVFGYLETEDNPFYWMSIEVNLNHRRTVSVTLDYCQARTNHHPN